MAGDGGAEAEQGNSVPTPEQIREMVVKSIRGAKDSDEAGKILKEYAVQLMVVTAEQLADELTPALGFSEFLLLNKSKSPEESRQFIQRIFYSVSDASKTVHEMAEGGLDLIDLVRAGEKTTSEHPEPVAKDLALAS